jgi:hypothetical protein
MKRTAMDGFTHDRGFFPLPAVAYLRRPAYLMGEVLRFISPLFRLEAPTFGTLRTFAPIGVKCRFFGYGYKAWTSRIWAMR